MGSRDIGHHQTKKPKKDAKKPTINEIIVAPVEVEVIRKKRKPEEER
jgi:hypothetical protein